MKRTAKIKDSKLSKEYKKYKFVYQTKNLINGKTYIGYHTTDNLNDGYIGCGVRSDAYAFAHKKRNVKSAFIDAVVKYGYKNFRREILSFYDKLEECIEEEKFLVNEEWVKSSKNYNISLGGFGGGGGKSTDKKTEEKIFSDFMLGMTKKEVCRKHKISKSVLYRITKNRDTSKRIINPNKKQRESKRKIEKYKDKIVIWFLEGKTKEEINKLVPFNLYATSILDNVKKYVAIKNGNVYYFNDTKDLQKIPGFKGKCMSHVRPALQKKQSHALGYKIVKKIDYMNGVTFYVEKEPIKTIHKGVVFVKDGKEYVVENSLLEFAKKHNLVPDCLYRIIKGKQAEHLGFRLKGSKNPSPIKTKYSNFVLIKDGVEYKIEYNLNEFCKKHNLKISSLHALVNGKQESYKKFKLK